MSQQYSPTIAKSKYQDTLYSQRNYDYIDFTYNSISKLTGQWSEPSMPS